MSTSIDLQVPFSITAPFTAPTQCAQSIGGLTMLKNDGFRIWLNNPLPVPGTTITSCYAPEFVSSFLLQRGGLSQPAMSPLVCPAGYTTQGPFTSNYIACCPSGWDGFAAAPDAPVDRPAFGGTCFRNIFGVPIRITSYDDASVKASSIFTATNSQAQAFAYPYEGFALGVAVVASTTSRAQPRTTTSSTRSTAVSADPFGNANQASTSRSSWGMAGVVIGSIVGALLMSGLIMWVLYRRKRLLKPPGYLERGPSIRLCDSAAPMGYVAHSAQHTGSRRGGGRTVHWSHPKMFHELQTGTINVVAQPREELETQSITRHEMDATPGGMISAKQLPKIPF